MQRIGDNKVIDVSVCITSAINKSTRRPSEQGLPRRDLIYCLDVLHLFLPPLRMRENDAKLLFLYLLNVHGRGNRLPVSRPETGALITLHSYPFIGNIRELKSIAERTCVFKTEDYITKQSLQGTLYPPDSDEGPLPAPARSLPNFLSLDEPEGLRSALEQSRGSRTRTIRILGMDHPTPWRKTKKYGL